MSVLPAYVHREDAVSASFTSCLTRLLAHDRQHRGLVGSGLLTVQAGSTTVPQARNQIVQTWLDQCDDEWLWTVDTDMGFAADTLDRLVDAADPAERPVVGALCFSQWLGDADGMGGFGWQALPTVYSWRQDESGHGFVRAVEYPREQLTRVAGTGAACLLVHRTAAEKLRAECGDEWFSQKRYPGGDVLAEDLSFCHRLGQVGTPVHVHTGVKTTHAKTCWIGERDFLAQRALDQQPAADTSA